MISANSKNTVTSVLLHKQNSTFHTYASWKSVNTASANYLQAASTIVLTEAQAQLMANHNIITLCWTI